MPTKRGNVYYVKRRVPGVGDVYRSLGTQRKGRARTLEDMLVTLARQGFPHLVRAWLNGRVDLAGLAEHYERGRVHELAEQLRHEDVPLEHGIRHAIRDKGPDVKGSTLQRYETGLEHFRRIVSSPELAGPEPTVGEALTTDHVQAFKGKRLEEGVARETVNNDLQAVSVLASYALRQGWITERPKVKRFKTQVRIRYLETSELPAYMAALRRPFRPLFQLLLGTGIRLGEAEGLRVRDLKLGTDGARALIEDSKTETGVRPVFVPAWVADTLRDHVEAEGLAGPDRLFSIPRRTVQKEHKRASKIVGLTAYTIHDHRHTAAVHLARAGMPLHLLQQQLGHARIDMTMRYARFHPEYTDVRQYFERVGTSFGLATESAVAGNSSGNTPETAEREALR